MALGDAARLGLEIRRARMRRGVSQRGLAVLLGLTAHSNVGDYERGRRIPPLDLVVACERALGIVDSSLRRWHERALAERANQWLADQLSSDTGDGARRSGAAGVVVDQIAEAGSPGDGLASGA